jgi:hypothetical protein
LPWNIRVRNHELHIAQFSSVQNGSRSFWRAWPAIHVYVAIIACEREFCVFENTCAYCLRAMERGMG